MKKNLHHSEAYVLSIPTVVKNKKTPSLLTSRYSESMFYMACLDIIFSNIDGLPL